MKSIAGERFTMLQEEPEDAVEPLIEQIGDCSHKEAALLRRLQENCSAEDKAAWEAFCQKIATRLACLDFWMKLDPTSAERR